MKLATTLQNMYLLQQWTIEYIVLCANKPFTGLATLKDISVWQGDLDLSKSNKELFNVQSVTARVD